MAPKTETAQTAAAPASEARKPGPKRGAVAKRARSRSEISRAAVHRAASRAGVKQLSRGATESMRDRLLAAMGEHLRAAADVATHCKRKRVTHGDLELVEAIRRGARPAAATGAGPQA